MQELFKLLEKRGLKLAIAESCTGGMIAAAVSTLPGSSRVFERGFVTYSNESKTEMLDVSEKILAEYGAVSAPVAEMMAQGALRKSHAHVAVSCTGIAGPDGGTESKPVGLVYIGLAQEKHPVKSYEHHFDGNRAAVRQQTVDTAFNHLRDLLANPPGTQ